MILSDELFRSLTDLSPQVDHGLRAVQRVPVTMEAAVVLLSGASENRHQMQANVLDISPIGIGLLLPQALVTGEHFAVRLKTLTDERFWLVSKTARCVPRAENLFLIGAHFIRVVQLNVRVPGDAEVMIGT